MLPSYLSTVSPYLHDKSRIMLLNSNGIFGHQTDNNHLISRLNGYVDAINDDESYQIYQMHHSHPFPDLDRERVYRPLISDLTLGDVSRQNTSISERYHKNLPRMSSLVYIYDPVYRHHRAISRGHERALVNLITSMDEETLNRQTIQPILST